MRQSIWRARTEADSEARGKSKNPTCLIDLSMVESCEGVHMLYRCERAKMPAEWRFMISFSKTAVMNFENAIRGARNPMNSWGRMDSFTSEAGSFVLGPNDLDLAQRLAHAGSDHRKYLRMIFVSVDIKAPLYWWKEYDTYKIATVANSTSTMHKIHSKPFSIDDFSCDHMSEGTRAFMEKVVEELESIRKRYIETKSKQDWYDMIQLLPSSYEQLRTCTFNYETLINIYHSRKDHKLAEWHEFCDWIGTLPYAKELIMI